MHNRTIRRLINHILLFLLLFFTSTATPAFALFGGSGNYTSLSELATDIAKETKNTHAGSRLYLDREDVRNDTDDTTSPFSGHFTRELENAFGNAGFRFESAIVDNADYRVTVTYRVEAEHVQVFVRLKNTHDSLYKAIKGDYTILLQHLPPGSFAMTLDTYLERLTKKIIQKSNHGIRQTRLVINQTVEARKGYSSPFGEYVTQRLKTLFASDSRMSVVEEKPSTAKIASMRTLADAGVEGTDTLLAGADAVLVDTYLGSADNLTLIATLKDRNGVVLARADESIPLMLIKHSLENDAAERTSIIADTEHEKGNNLITIRTTKGGGKHQIFKEGETVQFAVKVSKALFIYIYDINPKGEAVLLYPKEGEAEHPLTPDLLFTIPEARDSWEITVEPPFGTDAVKLFASEQKLPIPKIDNRISSLSFQGGTRALARQDKFQHELAVKKHINGHDLVDYYKGVANNLKVPLYESTVFVETRGK